MTTRSAECHPHNTATRSRVFPKRSAASCELFTPMSKQDFWSTREAAALLGIPEKSLLNAITNGYLTRPSEKFGVALIWRPVDLDRARRWLAACPGSGRRKKDKEESKLIA